MRLLCGCGAQEARLDIDIGEGRGRTRLSCACRPVHQIKAEDRGTGGRLAMASVDTRAIEGEIDRSASRFAPRCAPTANEIGLRCGRSLPMSSAYGTNRSRARSKTMRPRGQSSYSYDRTKARKAGSTVRSRRQRSHVSCVPGRKLGQSPYGSARSSGQPAASSFASPFDVCTTQKISRCGVSR
jgi:hypothetical protein